MKGGLVIELEDALRCALDGDAVLFVGAGVSFLSDNIADSKVPDAGVLIDILLNQARGTGSKHPLDRVAGHLVRTKGVDHVYDILKAQLTVKKMTIG